MGAKGHLLNSWKDNFWAGKTGNNLIIGNLQVKAKGDTLTVEFINKDESVYARCFVGKVKNKSVVKTSDSARG